jgi:hypothetical protein
MIIYIIMWIFIFTYGYTYKYVWICMNIDQYGSIYKKTLAAASFSQIQPFLYLFIWLYTYLCKYLHIYIYICINIYIYVDTYKCMNIDQYGSIYKKTLAAASSSRIQPFLYLLYVYIWLYT